MSKSPVGVVAPLIALMAGFVVWLLVHTLRSGRFGPWSRETHPANYWLRVINTALAIVLCVVALIAVVLQGSHGRRP